MKSFRGVDSAFEKWLQVSRNPFFRIHRVLGFVLLIAILSGEESAPGRTKTLNVPVFYILRNVMMCFEHSGFLLCRNTIPCMSGVWPSPGNCIKRFSVFCFSEKRRSNRSASPARRFDQTFRSLCVSGFERVFLSGHSFMSWYGSIPSYLVGIRDDFANDHL